MRRAIVHIHIYTDIHIHICIYICISIYVGISLGMTVYNCKVCASYLCILVSLSVHGQPRTMRGVCVCASVCDVCCCCCSRLPGTSVACVYRAHLSKFLQKLVQKTKKST